LECALQPKIAKINKNPLFWKHEQHLALCVAWQSNLIAWSSDFRVRAQRRI